MLTRRAVIGGFAALAPAALRPARAQTGTGLIETVVVPFAAGGPADITTRTIAPVLSERLQRKVIVENRAGAGGVTGLNMVATSKPDGRTIGFATVGAMAMAPHMMAMPFDPTRDIAYIGLIGKASELLVTSTQLPVRSFPEFLDYARKNPWKDHYRLDRHRQHRPSRYRAAQDQGQHRRGAHSLSRRRAGAGRCHGRPGECGDRRRVQLHRSGQVRPLASPDARRHEALAGDARRADRGRSRTARLRGRELVRIHRSQEHAHRGSDSPQCRTQRCSSGQRRAACLCRSGCRSYRRHARCAA